VKGVSVGGWVSDLDAIETISRLFACVIEWANKLSTRPTDQLQKAGGMPLAQCRVESDSPQVAAERVRGSRGECCMAGGAPAAMWDQFRYQVQKAGGASLAAAAM
jgi:hypothetical protein